MNVQGRQRRSGALVRLAAVAAMLALGASACGNDAAGEETPGADSASTTDAPSTTETETVDSEPAQGGVTAPCRAMIVDLLQAIEPYVAGHDAASMQSDDFNADGLAEAIAEIEEDLQVTCPRMDNPEAYEMMTDLAQQHAPGTVWYVEMMAAVEATRSRG